MMKILVNPLRIYKNFHFNIFIIRPNSLSFLLPEGGFFTMKGVIGGELTACSEKEKGVHFYQYRPVTS